MTMKKQKTLQHIAAVAVVLLALCLVFMAPVSADDSITVYTWKDLTTNLSSGGTVVLGQNIEVIWEATTPESLEVTTDATLDLNGYSISVSYRLTNPTSYEVIGVKGGNFIIMDSGTNGRISLNCDATIDPYAVSLAVIKIYNGASVELQKGDITVDAEPGIADTRHSGYF